MSYDAWKDSGWFDCFGERLRRLRESKGLSRKELASRARVHPGEIAQYELRNRLPAIVHFHKLADALGVSADELLGRDVNAADPVFQSAVGRLRRMDGKKFDAVVAFIDFIWEREWSLEEEE